MTVSTSKGQQLDLRQLVVCPVDHKPLTFNEGIVTCEQGHTYPLVDGIPVLLPEELSPTQESVVARTRKRVKQGDGWADRPEGPRGERGDVDPFVQRVVGATAGGLYEHRRGDLESYPIPEFPVSGGAADLVLDVGCNWGRWSIAAARAGFVPVGIDPNLKAVAAARRVARQLDVLATFLVADARHLPFRAESISFVFSYSVLQHFSRENARSAVSECARVLSPSGRCLVQMPNRYGLMSLYHQARRGFRPGRNFEVRYWNPATLRELFGEYFNEVSLEVEGFFGLGVGAADPGDVTPPYRWVVQVSRLLTRLAESISLLKYVADSLYVQAAAAMAREQPSAQ